MCTERSWWGVWLTICAQNEQGWCTPWWANPTPETGCAPAPKLATPISEASCAPLRNWPAPLRNWASPAPKLATPTSETGCATASASGVSQVAMITTTSTGPCIPCTMADSMSPDRLGPVTNWTFVGVG
jgi:hypothetical protein